MDYAAWPEKQLSVTNINLDPKNPRMPAAPKPLNQRHLIEELVSHDSIYDLAKSIANNGYFPVESLIVVREDGKTVVIEGNRRVAALKLLVSPDSAPSGQIARFRALSRRINTGTIRKVKAVIAPSREAASPILMNRHTGPQISSWKPIMKASYYHQLLQNGVHIEDLAQEYNMPVSEITKSLRLHRMYQIACSLDLPDDVSAIVRNPREFNATTLERFYVHRIGMDFLGIRFDNGNGVVGMTDLAEFKKGYKKLVSDIALDKVDSRTLHKTADIQKYLNSFSEDEKPTLSGKGNFTDQTILGCPESEGTSIAVKEVPKPPAATAKPKPKPKPRGLIPADAYCNLNNQRINDVFKELSTLPAAVYPNATAVLFRSLLEMSLSYYLYVTGDLGTMIQREKDERTKKGRPLKGDWQPALREMLAYLVDPKCRIINNNPNMVKVLQRFLSERDQLFSHNSLNFFVHNQYYPPNEQALRLFWDQLEGLFQIILVEPE